ncbi:universal stress protein [Phytohabitans kaempferiae]|uniref:Universal stress protein n=1 Tax=Phytohabitans kaempferiae TaxID=1620943 RepID=A0ABV6LYZ5_9ACTN
MRAPVVAGVDGSPASLVAAAHAAEAALRREVPLDLVHGYLHAFRYGVPLDPYPVQLPPPDPDAQLMLDAAAEELRASRPGLEVRTRQVAGGGAGALVDASRSATLVVVGSRGHGGFAGLLLGSVGAQVAAHAQCPALVVRPPSPPPPTGEGPIIVGVDGSHGAARALAYAAREARLRRTGLLLVHAWWLDARDGGVRETFAETEKAARAAAEELLDGAAAAVRETHPEVPVRRQLVHAREAAPHLVEASRDAALIVVGSRGRGGFTGLLLGSVSQELVHHAHCPVLVTHERDDAR